MRCFVTGGAGFIGSHLTDTLLAEGHAVTVFDNLSMGREENITAHQNENGFRFVKGDLLDYALLEKELAGHDFVWHLGANGNIPAGFEDVDLDLKNGVVATHNVLKAMRTIGVQEIVYSSSSTVYGDIKVYPTPETIGPLLPESLYGASKMAAEAIISGWCHLFGLRGWIFRFGNVVGARMHRGVIHDFIAKLQKNPSELEILGDGKGEKNYFLVEDCIDGMRNVVERARDKSCDVFNLGSQSVVSVDRIAEIVVEEMGLSNVRFRYTGGPRGWPGDVPVVKFDTSKVNRLGWEPMHTSADAVRITTRRLLGKA